MDTFLLLAPAVAGLYLLFIMFMINAYTTWATIIYKLLPFLVGCSSILVTLKLWGIL